MVFIKRLFRGRLNRQTYLFGVALFWLFVLFIDIPLLIDMRVHFPRPLPVDPMFYSVIEPFAFIVLICVQILYFFSMDVRRGHDLGAVRSTLEGQNIPFWHYYTKDGEKKKNKHGIQPAQQIDIKTLMFGEP